MEQYFHIWWSKVLHIFFHVLDYIPFKSSELLSSQETKHIIIHVGKIMCFVAISTDDINILSKQFNVKCFWTGGLIEIPRSEENTNVCCCGCLLKKIILMKFIQCPEKIFGYPGNKLSIFEKSFQNNCSKNQAAFYNEARKTNCIYGPIHEARTG